jgi:hypothetical protein
VGDGRPLSYYYLNISSLIHDFPRPGQPKQPPAPTLGGLTNSIAASRPLDLFLDGDAVALQEFPPGVEGFCLDPQGEMARPGGLVRRQLVALEGGFGQESGRTLASPTWKKT